MVVPDQDVRSEAVQPADRFGAAAVQVPLVEGGGRRIDEVVLVDIQVLILGGNEGRGSLPLFPGLEIAFPDILRHGHVDRRGTDVAGKRRIGLVLHQALVHVGDDGVKPAGHVHRNLLRKEVQLLVKGGIRGLGEHLEQIEVLIHHDHAVVAVIRHVDIVLRIHKHVIGCLERFGTASGYVVDDSCQLIVVVPVFHLQNPVVGRIHDIQVIVPDKQALGLVHLPSLIVQAQGDAVDHGFDAVRVRGFLYVFPVVVAVGIGCAVSVLVQVVAVIREGRGDGQRQHEDEQKRDHSFHHHFLPP